MTDDALRNQLLSSALQGLLASHQFASYPYYNNQTARDELAKTCVAITDAVMAENAKPRDGAR
jgi:hypothetical protein